MNTTASRNTGIARRVAANTNDWMAKVWEMTEAVARDYRRKHNGRKMNIVCWNATWERFRQQICGTAWACEQKRSFATIATLG